ncbi:SGNH/GDSL hydrolase family protein [Zwartia vadi]|uniref:SGNH/GDSL hydrolase family protein n=1 Tax=Zwartia vadi TaxID=3058168 RepID=UPI0025B40AFF|nr:SGNH/GDSL hydrolase family protein [Zwartia vadi]MDN3988231.1 SGNH/GDSL hydrolase family protein [Zwartia vadi]
MLIIVELICFGLYKLNPGEMLDWRYYSSAFEHTSKSTLPFGWSSPDGLPRPSQAQYPTICARAFGDSFTYGEEVYNPEQVWTSLASSELGCRIENYGVGGFGTDQALVLYESLPTNTPIVILSIYSEMLRRNLAASWLFYAGQKDRALKPAFKLNHQGQAEQISWPSDASINEHKKYHRHDLFFKSYDIKFPYFWHLSKSIFYQIKTRLENKGIFFDKHANTLPLQLALLDAFTAQVANRGSEMVLVFLPSIAELTNNDLSYRTQMNAYQAKHPKACVIDAAPALLEAMKKGIGVAAQSWHYNENGNAIVASVVAKGIKACNATKPLLKTVIGG